MTWTDLAVLTVVTAGILFVPGWLLARILGMRGLAAYALAAPFTATVVAISATVAPMIGLGWSLLSCLPVFLLVAAILFALRFAFRTRGHGTYPGRRWDTHIVLALAIPAVIIAAQIVVILGAPDAFSQTFDNVFHLNAIRFVLETSNASPFHVGGMTSATGQSIFYPGLWHAFASLTAGLTGSSIPGATNALILVSSCLIWPAGAVFLTRTIFGGGHVALLGAGVMSAAIPAFPILMIDFGVLYPYHLALCLLPAVLGVTLLALRIARDTSGATWVWVVAVLGALPGLLVAHPSAIVGWFIFAGIAVLVAYAGAVRKRSTWRRKAIATIGVLLFAALAVVAARIATPPIGSRGWPPTETIGQAVGEALTLSYMASAVSVVSVVLFVVGISVAVRRGHPAAYWLLFTIAIASALYVTVSGLTSAGIRDLLTASWYNNAPRLAAMAVVVVVPVAGAGVAGVWALVDRLVKSRRAARFSAWLPYVAGAVALAVLIVATQGSAIRLAVVKASESYAVTDSSPLVDTDELALIRRLPELTPRDAVIAGSPWTGTALAYALADRHVVQVHTIAEVDADGSLVNEALKDAVLGNAVCDAITRKNVEYVLDFGSREVHGGAHRYPGIEQLQSSRTVELIEEVGHARLYRVVACGEGR